MIVSNVSYKPLIAHCWKCQVPLAGDVRWSH